MLGKCEPVFGRMGAFPDEVGCGSVDPEYALNGYGFPDGLNESASHSGSKAGCASGGNCHSYVSGGSLLAQD